LEQSPITAAQDRLFGARDRVHAHQAGICGARNPCQPLDAAPKRAPTC
jgi:hypothetical protein